MNRPGPSGTWLTVAQAVERLAEVGVTRSPATIWQWISRGHLPVERVGRRVLFTEQALMVAERDTRRRNRRSARSAASP